MRRLLASGWFPVLTMLVLAAATVLSYVLVLKPTGADIGNDQILNAAKIAGYAIGPVAALLSLLLAFILNGIRRLCKIRTICWLHPLVVLAAVLPWCLFAWQMVMEEPRYTAVARAVIDFTGKPLFLGCTAALAFILLCSLLALIPSRSTKKK